MEICTMGEYKYLFGPVPSRRFGRSLGVDLTPYKTCSLDCVFCQLGTTTKKTVQRQEFVPTDKIPRQVDARRSDPRATRKGHCLLRSQGQAGKRSGRHVSAIEKLKNEAKSGAYQLRLWKIRACEKFMRKKTMICERCKTAIPLGEQWSFHGQILCEDCYMDFLSPLRVCDPWAVHSAMTFLKGAAEDLNLTPAQEKIVDILNNEGPQKAEILCERLQIKETDFERDIAALRHMEKIRGELRDGKKLIRLW